MCRMNGCFGAGELVRVNGQLSIHLCPRHSLELKDEGFDVVDLTGNQKWLWPSDSNSGLVQADGAA